MWDVAFDGIMDFGTWKLAAGIERGTNEGQLVKVSSAKTVSLCDAEDIFLGKLITIDKGNEVGVVQEKGYQKVTYTGTAPAVGNHVELVADGNGGVQVPGDGVSGLFYVVASVDTETGTVMMRLG